MGKMSIFSIVLLTVICLLAGSVMATPPPVLQAPPNGGEITTCGTYTFNWTDLQSDWFLSKYHIAIDEDNNFSGDVVYRAYPGGSSVNVNVSGFKDNFMYYWGVQTEGKLHWYDGWAWSSMTTATFYTNFPGLETIEPVNGGSGISQRPVFKWSEHCHYKDLYCWRIIVDNNSDFSSPIADWHKSGGGDPLDGDELPTGVRLSPGTTYYWKAMGFDESCETNMTGWTNVGIFTTCPSPETPSMISPANSAQNVTLPVNIEWGHVAEADYYNLQVDDDNGFAAPIIDLEQAGVQYSANILLEGMTYFWRIRAYSEDCGWSSWSTPRSFTTQCPVPDAPVLALPPSGETGLSRPVTLQWNNVSGAINYRLQVADNFSFTDPILSLETTELSYDADGLEDATKYYWHVGAENDCGWSIWSNIWNFTSDCPTYDPPVLVYPTNNQDDLDIRESVILDWEDVSDAIGYRLQIADNETMTDPLVDNDEIAVSTYTANESFLIGTWYYWRVNTEKDVCGNGDWSTLWKFQFLCPSVEIPTLLNPSNGAISVTQPITMEWDDIADAEKYHIQVDDNIDFSSTVINNDNIVSSDMILPNVSEGVSYNWRVRAYNGCQWGGWSSNWSFIAGEQTNIAINESNKLPDDFSLKQNFPNPFNPQTTIEFSIPRAEYVTLEIHNILGENVAKLVSEHLTAGWYSVNWDAATAPTGIYFYCINAGNFSQTKKMILLK